MFDVNLGALPISVNLSPPRYCKKPRSPSYFRRQEKRRQEQSNDEAKTTSKGADLETDDDSAENGEVCNDDASVESVVEDFYNVLVTSDAQNITVNDDVNIAEIINN